MTDQPQTLTNKTLERIRALVKGNGLAAERVTVLDATEATHTVHGVLQIQPHFDIQSRAVQGRVKSKGPRLLPSFEAMEKEITDLRKEFEEGSEWIEQTRAELDKAPGKGWGEEGTDVTWDAQSTHLAATENCPSCHATGSRPCPYCQGLGFKTCHYCEGRGKELCPNCGGTGNDPATPGTPCHVCHGERFAECRFCHLSGKLNCEHCQGKANLPCTDCNGTGFLSRETKITKKATLRFALGETTQLPSGLLRMMQRIGLDKMGGALADIETAYPAEDPESGAPRNVLLLTARVPYAEIKMKIGSKQGKIIAFGKAGRLSGVPPFLDEILAPARGMLVKVVKGEMVLEKVLGLRVMKDALGLSLAGKTHPNELRRLYPVGLTPDAAKEIMANMGLALRTQTKATRQLIGWGYATFCGLVFSALMFTPLLDIISNGRGAIAAFSVQLLVLAGTLGGGQLVLSNAARWALKQKYPDAKIGRTQTIGRTGLYVFAAIIALYIAIFLLSGHARLLAL